MKQKSISMFRNEWNVKCWLFLRVRHEKMKNIFMRKCSYALVGIFIIDCPRGSHVLEYRKTLPPFFSSPVRSRKLPSWNPLHYFSMAPRGLRGTLNEAAVMAVANIPNLVPAWKSYTEKTSIPFPFIFNGELIVVTVFLSILNQMELHLVQNRKENCHHDHFRLNMKGNGILVFSVCQKRRVWED